MNIKSEYEFYEAINQQQQQMYFENEKINRGGRKQIKSGTTKRNARERNRVRYINYCFDVLRQHIPVSASTTSTISDDQTSITDNSSDLNKKLSKVETLKFATQYIKQLTVLLEQLDNNVYTCNTEINENIVMISPSTSPFSLSSSSTSSTSQHYQDFSINASNDQLQQHKTPYYNHQPSNIYNNNQMQIDCHHHPVYPNQVCSYSANHNASNFMENQNQYFQYYF